MAGKLRIGRSVPLSRSNTLNALPAIQSNKLKGGVRYYDCQFDDARLSVNLSQTLFDLGGIALNYMEVTDLTMQIGKVDGVKALDRESGREFEIRAKAVINATGVFVDQILRMENPDARDVVKPSQGIHLVMHPNFLRGQEALMIPRTSDGRVLFAVPWHNRVVVGTTDVEKQHAELEPHAEEAEIEYILETAKRYMGLAPKREEVLSVFTGLRPLAAPSTEGKKTKEISRGHKIMVSRGGLITLTGGKWTTYRKMGEDVVDKAASLADLPRSKSVTPEMKIHGYEEHVDRKDPLHWYGSDLKHLKKLIEKDPEMGEVLSEELHIYRVQIVWAAREEMARTLEDCLARRTRALQLDARESIRIAPRVAEILAEELGYNKTWEDRQVKAYTQLASTYLVDGK
jgi:glycerol-3-phosphate dehydrogenase